MSDKVKVFRTKIVSVRKKRKCAVCGEKIEIKQKAVNTTFSYDERLISVYFCGVCDNII